MPACFTGQLRLPRRSELHDPHTRPPARPATLKESPDALKRGPADQLQPSWSATSSPPALGQRLKHGNT